MRDALSKARAVLEDETAQWNAIRLREALEGLVEAWPDAERAAHDAGCRVGYRNAWADAEADEAYNEEPGDSWELWVYDGRPVGAMVEQVVAEQVRVPQRPGRHREQVARAIESCVRIISMGERTGEYLEAIRTPAPLSVPLEYFANGGGEE